MATLGYLHAIRLAAIGLGVLLPFSVSGACGEGCGPAIIATAEAVPVLPPHAADGPVDPGGGAPEGVDDATTLQVYEQQVRNYEAAGAYTESDAAFRRYAVVAGRMRERAALVAGVGGEKATWEGRTREVGLLLQRGETLFRRSDHLRALAVFDDVRLRHPRTDGAACAIYMIGRYYEVILHAAGAIDAFEEVVREYPGSPWAESAALLLPGHYWGTGRKAAAAEAWRRYAELAGTDECKAFGYYNFGLCHYRLIPEGPCVEGDAAMRRIIKEFGQTLYADLAERVLAGQRKKRLERFLSGQPGKF